MRCLTFGVLVALASLTGCDVNVSVGGGGGEPEAGGALPAEGGEGSGGPVFEGFGVKVESGPDGTTWKAPFSEGSVKDGKVDVTAPGTKVDVDMNTGETSVTAPGTSVEVK